jgi:hypothetical protein
MLGVGGVLIMATTLECRLDALVHEIQDIKKELILDKVNRLTVTRGRTAFAALEAFEFFNIKHPG